MLWGIVFLLSVGLLVFVLLRNRSSARWLGTTLVHFSIAAICLYGINETSFLGDLNIGINAGTVAIIGILGLPGLVLLTAVKAWIV